MMKTEIEHLYKRIETTIDQLEVGQTKNFEAPEYSSVELMTIPKILEYLKSNKYKDSVTYKTISMRTIVSKVKKDEEVSTSPFANLVIEKSQDEIEAEDTYKACLAKQHKLVETNKTTYKNPIMICQDCKLGFLYKLGKKGFSKIIRVSI